MSLQHCGMCSRGTQRAWRCSHRSAGTIQSIEATKESNPLRTDNRDGSVPNKCHLSAHITGMLPAATDSFSLHPLHADSYPYWWLWLYSAESCSTTGSLAGLSIMSTSLSLRYGLPGKSPFTSDWVPGGSMPVGSSVCRSGSVTSSSIRLLDAAVLSAAADCLSTDNWSRLPPQFGFVPEQQHRLPETRC